MQVTNQSFFVEELERAVAFGVDGVSEVAFNCWKYRDDRAALMVVGCIVDLLANRKFRHRELLAWLLQDDPVAGHLDGRSMSRPQRKGCDAGHVQHAVWAKVVTACLTTALNARLRPEEKLILPRGQMPVMTGLLVGFTSLKSPRDNAGRCLRACIHTEQWCWGYNVYKASFKAALGTNTRRADR
jgi:hypothetical protein